MEHNINNIEVSNSYLEFDGKFYDYSKISPLNNPIFASLNTKLCEEIGIKFDSNDQVVDLLNGHLLLKNSKPYSMAYAGHQFGFYVPQLGDGRAINIGSIGSYHFQLKGSGLTKYSRHGDGKAVLRSSIREYLMSEYINSLGIATTRALAIISSHHKVYRDMSYEKGAIVLRVSSSWVRFGTFEYFSKNGTKDDLKQLANYVIKQNFPQLISLDEDIKYEKLFFAVMEKTAILIGKWQAYGFMHGVLNTDNMSAAGLSIDYGPYAFMDNFDRTTVCNHTDRDGRYSYENQPYIGKWNLASLAVAIEPIVNNKIRLNEYLQIFESLCQRYYYGYMNERLGLDENLSGNRNVLLIDELLDVMEKAVVDYNLFFRKLGSFKKQDIFDICTYRDHMVNWLDKYNKIIDQQKESKEMKQHQPPPG